MEKSDFEVDAYDEVPYESYPFAQSHPFRLATQARLFGMTPTPPSRARILELGCASGGNLLPLAEIFPEARLIGLDASARQIEQGQEAVRALGYPNVELRRADILDVDSSLGQFDYIIAHGVYSWVPERVQRKLLDICCNNLTDNGIAYVSYNTFPGWRLRGMIRDLMSYRAHFFSDSRVKLQEGRALLDFLAKSTPTEGNAYGTLLSQELKSIQKKQDYYLIHEHLEDTNEPVYFYQFMERADAAGLQYLGEADYSVMMTSNFPPDVEAMVSQLARRKEQTASEVVDLIQLEQYMDFVRNRHFRQTLLCKKGIPLERPAAPERVREMFVASPARPENPIQDLRSHEEVLFRRTGSTLKTTTPLLKAAMVILAERWPQSIHFRELIAAARARIDPNPSVVESGAARGEEEKLNKPLLHCYATTHVDLNIGQFPFTLKVTDFPLAMRLSRYQAGRGIPVTNLWHETVPVTDIQRRILPLLDGTHDSTSIADRLAIEVSQGKLVVRDRGEPVEQAQRVREILEQLVQDNLGKLAGLGVLCIN